MLLGGVFYRQVFTGEDWMHKADLDTANIFVPVDTLDMPLCMKYLSNDPYYWVDDGPRRDSLYRAYYEKKFSPAERSDQVGQHLIQGWSHSPYKVTLHGRQLTLVRLDSLTSASIPAQTWALTRRGSTRASPRR